MPTRTYTGIDFTNYTEGFFANGGVDAAVATPFGNFHVTITSSGNVDGDGTPPVPGFIVDSAIYTYLIQGSLDFDAFPAIPAGALIQSVEVKVDIEVSATANAHATSPNLVTVSASVSGNFQSVLESNIGVMTGIIFSAIDSEQNFSLGPVSEDAAISINQFDHYTATELFDYTGAPITKAQLVADFSDWIETLTVNLSASSQPGEEVASHVDETSGFTLSGVRVTITYIDGGISYSVNPSGGNVQPGQIITVTGPIAEEYAAIIDGKVVPIEPKIIGPDEILLEIPYPATDPCFDCFPSCPECEDAFDPCDADLAGDACQEAMQACLDCLTNCLEDLQLAEECQESSQNPPNTPTIPVVLIAGTQFSGSVMLGNFVILNADGSGLYKFTIGKTNDTLYHGDRDGTTYNVKIPNPGGKTGFFRS